MCPVTVTIVGPRIIFLTDVIEDPLRLAVCVTKYIQVRMSKISTRIENSNIHIDTIVYIVDIGCRIGIRVDPVNAGRQGLGGGCHHDILFNVGNTWI